MIHNSRVRHLRVVGNMNNLFTQNPRPSATVGLFTGDHRAPFYRQFGFMQAVGMYRAVGKET